MKILCLTHDMLQSVIVSGVAIYHISNVNGVLEYTPITAIMIRCMNLIRSGYAYTGKDPLVCQPSRSA